MGTAGPVVIWLTHRRLSAAPAPPRSAPARAGVRSPPEGPAPHGDEQHDERDDGHHPQREVQPQRAVHPGQVLHRLGRHHSRRGQERPDHDRLDHLQVADRGDGVGTGRMPAQAVVVTARVHPGEPTIATTCALTTARRTHPVGLVRCTAPDRAGMAARSLLAAVTMRRPPHSVLDKPAGRYLAGVTIASLML